MPHTKPRKSKQHPRHKPSLYHCWQARKADVLTIIARVAPISQIVAVVGGLVNTFHSQGNSVTASTIQQRLSAVNWLTKPVTRPVRKRDVRGIFELTRLLVNPQLSSKLETLS